MGQEFLYTHVCGGRDVLKLHSLLLSLEALKSSSDGTSWESMERTPSYSHTYSALKHGLGKDFPFLVHIEHMTNINVPLTQTASYE